jgi:hypothetical protein
MKRIQFIKVGRLAALAAATLVGVTAVVPTVRGGTNIWVANRSGYWSSAANWAYGGVPGAGDVLMFPEATVSAGLFSTNNLAAGTSFHTILLWRGSGVGYGLTLRGNAVGLTHRLVAGNLYASASVDLDITRRCTVTPFSVSLLGRMSPDCTKWNGRPVRRCLGRSRKG